MLRRACISGIILAASLAACDRPKWPDSQGEMARIFEQQKDTFLEFEREMAADGLRRMSPGVFSEMARNPTIPALPSQQASKYLELLEKVEIFVSVIRRNEATEFEMMIENVGPRLYLSRFIHASTFESVPRCAEQMDTLACGSCAVKLENDWQLKYSWFPASPDEEARLC